MQVETLLEHRFKRLCTLTEATGSGTQFKGKCPAHTDSEASLSLRMADGKILLNCFAGCKKAEILKHLNWEPRHLLKGAVEVPDIEPTTFETQQAEQVEDPKFREVERYQYHQPDGSLQFYVIRQEATDSKGKRKKKFLQSGIASDGSLTWRMAGIKRLPYRLPQVLKAIEQQKSILFVEGEKDVGSAENLGFVATTIPSGAKKSGGENVAEECLHWLKGADVVLCPDNDEVGIPWQQMIGSRLLKIAKRVRWLELPELGEKEDLSDWLAKGNGLEALQSLMDQAVDFQVSEVEEQHQPSSIKALSLAQLLTLELPERKCLMAPWLPEQGLAMVYAQRGVGKSWFTWQIALSVATGAPFLNWQIPEPKRVLLIDGEMPCAVTRERFEKLVEALPVDPPENLPLSIITPDIQELGMPDLSDEAGQQALEPFVDEADLIVVDNISTLVRNGRENETESWVPIQAWALKQRVKRKTILFIHHAGKGGDQRGSSKREDVLDTVIALKRPTGYSPEEGARFEVHFTKSRGFHGEDAEPIDLSLSTDELGRLQWTSKSLQQSTYERVLEYLREGLSQSQIATLMEITKQAVHKHVKRAKEVGEWCESTKSFP